MKRGFTLIELLVVIAIVALLISILIGSIGGCGGTENTLTATIREKYTAVTPVGESTSPTFTVVDTKGNTYYLADSKLGWGKSGRAAQMFGMLQPEHEYEFVVRVYRTNVIPYILEVHPK